MPAVASDPFTLAETATRLVASACQLHNDGAAQREVMREARAVVADLKEAAELASFNPAMRNRVRESGEALHEAWLATPKRRGFWLAFAKLTLERINRGTSGRLTTPSRLAIARMGGRDLGAPDDFEEQELAEMGVTARDRFRRRDDD